MLGIGLLCLVLDLAYIGLLVHAGWVPGTEPRRSTAAASAEV